MWAYKIVGVGTALLFTLSLSIIFPGYAYRGRVI